MQTILSSSKVFLRTINHGTRSVNIDLGNQAQIENLVEIYSTYQPTYSAVIVLIKLSDVPDSPRIANVYGKFDFSVLGNSFNLPPSGAEAAEVDMSIPQMTAFKGDAAGAQYFSAENAPPPCAEFNYSIMSMEVSSTGEIGLKPKGWKSGDALAYTLKTAEMQKMPITDLPNVASWCRSASQVVALPQVVLETKTTTETQNNMTAAIVAIVIIVLLLIFFSYYSATNGRSRKTRKGVWF